MKFNSLWKHIESVRSQCVAFIKKSLFFLFKNKPHEYAAQIKLAKQITLLVHGG